jgi:hypothetical protein
MGVYTSKQFFEGSCRNLNLANVVDVNGIVHCASHLKGLNSNSASPTDVLLFDFQPGTHYNGEPISKGFQKLFISNVDELASTINIASLDESEVLLYEYYIYLYKIRPLTEHSINPHFVKVLGGKLDIPTDKMINYILEKGFNYSNNPSITTRNFIKNRVYHNLTIMIHNISNRLSITDMHNNYTSLPPPITTKTNVNLTQQQVLDSVKYGFILTEGMNYNNQIKSYSQYVHMSQGECITLNDFLTFFKNEYQTNQDVLNEMYRLYFQLLTACYAMYLSGFNHNDLHPGNVWIKRVPNCVNQYSINDKVYSLRVSHTVLLYDFDRAYLHNYDNILDRHINNELNRVNNKDVLQLFSYIYYNFTSMSCVDITQNNTLNTIRNHIRNTILSHPSDMNDYQELKNILGDCHNPNRDTHIAYRLKNLPGNFNPIDIMIEKWYNYNKNIMNYGGGGNIYIYTCNRQDFTNYNINTQQTLRDIVNVQIAQCNTEKIAINQAATTNINNLVQQCNTEKIAINQANATNIKNLEQECKTKADAYIDNINKQHETYVKNLKEECKTKAETYVANIKKENESLKNQINTLKTELAKYNDNKMID